MNYFVISKFGKQEDIPGERPASFQDFLNTNEDIAGAIHTEHGDMLWAITRNDICTEDIALDKCRYGVYGCYFHVIAAFTDYREEDDNVTLEDLRDLRDWLDNALYLGDADNIVHIYGFLGRQDVGELLRR